MTLRKNLLWAQRKLAHFDNPRLEAEVLLSDLLEEDRMALKFQEEENLSFTNFIKYRYWVYKRSKYIPIAYIVGYKYFAGERFKVNFHTLIPRDETEILLEHIKNHKRSFSPGSLLDIGTGSGIIAITYGAECRGQGIGIDITALDISRPALRVACCNAHKHNIEINFLHSDMLSGIQEGSRFDIIVANLPYVPSDMKIERDLLYEPSTAIFSGDDGLLHIKRLRDELRKKKIVFKELWLEFLPQQEKEIKKLFKDYKTESKKDLSGEVFFMVITEG